MIPLIDGCFLIDNSGLEKLKCPRAFQYSEVLHRSLVASKAGANFGSTIHRGLETRYQLCGTNEVDPPAQLAIESAMHDWLNENPQPEMDFRNFNHACKMLQVYNRIYKKEDFRIVTNQDGKPVIEASFMLPFALFDPKHGVLSWTNPKCTADELKAMGNTPIFYCGKIDLGIENTSGFWSFDHKTAFQFGETFDAQMSMDGGQLGYCWALGQVLGKPASGYIIDAIRVRKPKRDSDFTGEAVIDGTDFKRIPFPVTPEQIDEWREDVMAILDDVFHHSMRDYYPRHRWNCTNKFGKCDYFDVCSTVRHQRDIILDSGMFEENKWSKGLKV